MKRIFNLILLFILISISTGSKAFAANVPYTNYCSSLSSLQQNAAPHPLAAFCAMARFLNSLILPAGAIFVLMLILGSIKMSMSQGDPKALEAAKGTITHAVIGFLVIIGYFVINQIIQSSLGLRSNIILSPLEYLADQLQDLFRAFGIQP